MANKEHDADTESVATEEAAVPAAGRVAGEPRLLLDVETVAALLNCSTKTVYRLSDAGKMPRAVKLGRSVRWSRVALEAWIAAGCKAPTKG